jgi:hypothetical protein
VLDDVPGRRGPSTKRVEDHRDELVVRPPTGPKVLVVLCATSVNEAGRYGAAAAGRGVASRRARRRGARGDNRDIEEHQAALFSDDDHVRSLAVHKQTERLHRLEQSRGLVHVDEERRGRAG